MKLDIINYQQANDMLGDNAMIEILGCLERNDKEAIENIMLQHEMLNYILYYQGENLDIIFIKR